MMDTKSLHYIESVHLLRFQLIGDITNWMNSTSGEFNYTGLVANMEMKAGSFYGMHLQLLHSVMS
jgi:hypothetical protein